MIATLLSFGAFLSLVVYVYLLLGLAALLFYRPLKSRTPYERVNLVLVTIGVEKVKGALEESLKHHASMFSRDRFFVVTDEGAELMDWLCSFPVTVVMVPKDFKTSAVAKGRAIDFFIKHYVKETDWYVFVDDDNLILDSSFLYEIEPQERLGKVAANPVLVPRRGRSTLTFIADWVRTLDDLTLFRFTTGLLSKPYLGFHGELLLVRGDVLKDVGYDRPSIVEDFAFANAFVKKGYWSWQTDTKVSILSPHSVKDFFRQRSRWYNGLIQETTQRRIDWRVFITVVPRLFVWRFALFGSWFTFPFWYWFHASTVPLWVIASWSVGILYALLYVYGSIQTKHKKWYFLGPLLIPIFGLMSHISPWYAVLTRKHHNGRFEVIDK